MKAKVKNPHAPALVVILLLAALLRLYGIDFGNPHTYHPDEMKLIAQAGHLLQSHFFDKEAYFVFGVYPVFFSMVLAVLLAVYIVLAVATGHFESIQFARIAYQNDPFIFFLVGRLFVALLGVVSVYVLYKLCKSAFNQRVGLIAAALLSVNFVHVRNSHFATVDIAAALFALLALYFFVRIDRCNRLRDYTLAAVFMAFAVSAKFSLFLIAFPFLVVCIKQFIYSKNRLLLSKSIGAAILIGLLVFLVTSPIFLLDFQETYGGIVGTTEFEKVGKIGSGGGLLSYWTGSQAPGFGVFYPNSIPDTFGLPLTLLVLAGLLYQLYRHKSADIMLLSFVLSTYFMFDHFAYKAMRHILPVVPLFLVSAAVVLDAGVAKLKTGKNIQNAVLWILVAVFAFFGVHYCLYYFSILRRPDPRTLASKWIGEHIPQNSKIAVESFAPPLAEKESTASPYEVISIELTRRQDKMTPIWRQRLQTCDYYISDGFSRAFFNWKQTKARYPDIVRDRKAFFQFVQNEFTLVKRFKAIDPQLQPDIKIYRIPDAAEVNQL